MAPLVMCSVAILLAILLWASHCGVLAQVQSPGAGFISIDCGASQAYTDNDTTGLVYDADRNISTGVEHQISPSLNTIPRRDLLTLRAFPADSTPTKNCYEIPVESGTQYLVRANSFFGNYTTPPASGILEFQLAVDTTVWLTLQIDTSDTEDYYFGEVLVVATKPILSVCLIRTNPDSAPIISSIELRPLSYKFYLFRFADPTSVILYTMGRLNFGGLPNTIRFPDDAYDRLWTPSELYPGWVNVSTSSILSIPSIRNFGYGNVSQPWHLLYGGNFPVSSNQTIPLKPFYQWDDPPSVVMQTVANGGNDFGLNWFIDTSRQINAARVYATVFFAEIMNLTGGTRRVMQLTSNFIPTQANYITLDLAQNYSSFTVVEFGGDSNISGGTATFSLNRDPTSDYDPIVNAFEIYLVIDKIQGTRVPDATALTSLRALFKFVQWSGDPCFPVPWDEIMCTDDKVTSLNISAKNLSGVIPSDLSSLSELTYLDLSNNNFSGGLPTWLPELVNLKTLDVSNNNLSGTFSADIVAKIQNFRFSGNPQLVFAPSSTPPSGPPPSVLGTSPVGASKSKTSLGPVIGGIVGGVLIIFLVAGCLTWYFWCKPKNASIQTPGSPLLGDGVSSSSSNAHHAFAKRRKAQPYTVQAITDATTNFSRKIGEGGFGPVYYGVLQSGQQVAVKIMSGKTRQGLTEYINEIDLLSTAHYKKVVSLVGYCHKGGKLILLYEYMQGGDLRQRLYGADSGVQQAPLTWRQRLEIALDAAKGLEYLHHGCSPAIFHRDVKTSNILLSHQLEAKVADFGLSKLSDEGQTHVTTVVKGTPGYLDPEYNTTGMLTDKSDVYSFGVVLLELLCGHSPIMNPGSGGMSMVEKVRVAFEHRALLQIVDPALRSKFNQDSVWKYVELALQCVTPSSKERPGMNQVVADLTQALQLQSLAGDGVTSSGGFSNPTSDLYSQSSSVPDEPSQIFHADERPTGR